MDSRAVDKIPTKRLAELITTARERGDVELALLAARSGVTQRALRRWERGSARPSVAELERLAFALGLSVDEVVPPRTPVVYHPSTKTLTVGHHTAAVISAAGDPDQNEAVLRTYVKAVAASRSVEPGAGLRLRSDDIEALAVLLDLDDADLQGRLAAILGVTPEVAAETHRRLIARRAATIAAALSVGVLTSFPLSTAAAVQTNVTPRSATPQTNVTTVPASSITSGGATGDTTITTTTLIPAPPAPQQVVITPPAPPTPPPARHAAKKAAPAAAPTPAADAPHEQLPNDADGDGIDIGTALVIERAVQPDDPNTQLGDSYTESR